MEMIDFAKYERFPYRVMQRILKFSCELYLSQQTNDFVSQNLFNVTNRSLIATRLTHHLYMQLR